MIEEKNISEENCSSLECFQSTKEASMTENTVIQSKSHELLLVSLRKGTLSKEAEFYP
jgi:hypothetical protein